MKNVQLRQSRRLRVRRCCPFCSLVVAVRALRCILLSLLFLSHLLSCCFILTILTTTCLQRRYSLRPLCIVKSPYLVSSPIPRTFNRLIARNAWLLLEYLFARLSREGVSLKCRSIPKASKLFAAELNRTWDERMMAAIQCRCVVDKTHTISLKSPRPGVADYISCRRFRRTERP